MTIKEFLKYEKDLQSDLLSFLTESNSNDGNSLNFLISIDSKEIQENRQKLKELLNLILHVVNNCHRSDGFYDKISRILMTLKPAISKFFTKTEILDIFKSNKLILLCLIELKFIESNKRYFYDLISMEQYRKEDYLTFFYYEIKNFLSYQLKQEIETKLKQLNLTSNEEFYEKRRIGENGALICKYIREDSIELFIEYINKRAISLKATIEPSIFETNGFLINKKMSLIEYSAFYGSIQIFQYLFLNNVSLTPSLWICAIHGSNPEMIHFLEENKILPKDKTYIECLIESIKCHYIELSKYFILNFISCDIQSVYENESLKFFNYNFFPEELNNDNILFNLIQYNYNTIVKIILDPEDSKFNVNSLIISIHFFFIKFQKKKKFYSSNSNIFGCLNSVSKSILF